MAKGSRGTKVLKAGPGKTKVVNGKTGGDRGTIAAEEMNQQMLNALWIPTDADDETKRSTYTTAQVLLNGMNPTDAIEGMLAI